jgi:hypothetical protein
MQGETTDCSAKRSTTMEQPAYRLQHPTAPYPTQAGPAERACPRCHVGLSAIRHPVRREGLMTAWLCPSVTCGYKLIAPL